MTHEHDLHRFDCEGGHQGHPERIERARRSFMKAAERLAARWDPEAPSVPAGELMEMLTRLRSAWEWYDHLKY